MRQVPILMYHWFRPTGSSSQSRSPQLEITPELFERQIIYLRKEGYRAVSLETVISSAKSTALSFKPIIIAVDDGTMDFWKLAKPVLDKYGFIASLFVVTGHVGGKNSWDRYLGEPSRTLMSWEHIIALHKSGFDINSHTHTHRILPELSENEIQRELAESRGILGDKLGIVPKYIAYPRGSYNARVKELTRKVGYQGGCGVILKWKDLMHSDAYALKRMTIKGTESMRRFTIRLGLSKVIPFVQQ